MNGSITSLIFGLVAQSLIVFCFLVLQFVSWRIQIDLCFQTTVIVETTYFTLSMMNPDYSVLLEYMMWCHIHACSHMHPLILGVPYIYIYIVFTYTRLQVYICIYAQIDHVSTYSIYSKMIASSYPWAPRLVIPSGLYLHLKMRDTRSIRSPECHIQALLPGHNHSVCSIFPDSLLLAAPLLMAEGRGLGFDPVKQMARSDTHEREILGPFSSSASLFLWWSQMPGRDGLGVFVKSIGLFRGQFWTADFGCPLFHHHRQERKRVYHVPAHVRWLWWEWEV